MCRAIAISLVVVTALVMAIRSENVLKCYMCTSLSNKDCGSNMTQTELVPVECTGNEMMRWQRIIEQHDTLKSIARLFEVDGTLLDDQRLVFPLMACAKIIINVKNEDVIIRTCQMAKTEHIDPCKTMGKKMSTELLGKMEKCTLCIKDACNGARGVTTLSSSEMFYVLLSYFSILVHAVLYRA